ncbi:ATP-binding cassette domain-containing protein [Halarcobacter bivalviorum]|uniref:ABC transporter, ATP-binding protein n=1 Tax=Halarcobacter bivalviorum TaxID=663364 RepID=A0AAX2A623_9BACT|nr:ATP-binding cassette domain-containing protein [Halarcobacter bivalviorum]AXH12908.1 ABC transporter, ATP-binding protein [Halarcobacter bivalviorum]RXK08971.1 peptide ABC transporter ATP-binding protein [Halarcobacter bivalviorum]
MNKEDAVLNIENLSFGYAKDKLIYKDFNLEVKKSELISIVGSSGSGKSTLFELISNNLKPQKGTITSKKISSVYQDPYSSFHPSFIILEQIKDVVFFNEEIKRKLENFLDKLNLDFDLINKKPHELSGGQLQRCSILRALLMEPDLLLVDEPTSALDNIVAIEVMNLLIDNLDKCGMLLITHDNSLANWCSDKIINLNELQKD